jgi:rod shape-determining protein MreC
VTSGLDGIYPAGLAVATVARIERNLKDQFARVVLMPAAGVRSHNHLLLLRAEPPAIAPPPAERKAAERRGAKK